MTHLIHSRMTYLIHSRLSRIFCYACAIAEEEHGPGGRAGTKFRHAATLFHRGRIVASGINSLRKTHPLLIKYTKFPYIHAEQAAIFAAGLDLSRGCDIMVVRLKADGSPTLSKPCAVCASVMQDVGIRRVFYSTEDGIKEL